jgi:rhomboid family GlyGly-CTERM serine protease
MITKASARLQSLNADGRYGLALLLSLLLLLLPAAGGAAWRDAWRYDRAALAAGQWWRLIGAHAVHLNARHLAFNLAGLVLLWLMFARRWRPTQWLAIVLMSMAGIGAGLWWLSPAVQWYVGASGVLHGIWAAGAWAEWRRAAPRTWLPAILLALKLVAEQWQGASLVAGDMPVVQAAHVYGAVGGLLMPLLWQLRRS